MSDSESSFDLPSMEELAQMIPQYPLEGFIAQGGMGAVYLARQPALDRYVAIKVLPASWVGEIDFAARFQSEARAMARLQHNAIVSIYDFGVTSSGHLYLVMEYVSGETLHHFIQTAGLSEQHVQSYALQLCDALQYAHEHGIIHRDIKPANVMINHEGRVKVADFGLARPAAAMEQEVQMGTPEYAAPEIAEGHPVDHRADIYAFGILIYEMLTRTTPCQTQQPASAMAAVDHGWDEIITKATRALPQDRYQTIRDMRAALMLMINRSRYGGAHAASHSHEAPPRTGFPVALTGLLGLVLLAAGGGWYWWTSHREPVVADGGKLAARSTAPTPQMASISNTTNSTPSTESKPAVEPPEPGFNAPPPPPLSLNLDKAEPGYLAEFPLGHQTAIAALAPLADGQRVLSVSGKIMRLWRVATGEHLHTYHSPVPMLSVAVSNDGRYAAVGCEDERLRVWDLDSGEIKAEGSAAGKNTIGIGFSADGKTLVSAAHDKTDKPVEVWSWDGGSGPVRLGGWRKRVVALALPPGGTDGAFATVGDTEEGTTSELCLGNFLTREQPRVLSQVSERPTKVALSAGKDYVAICGGKEVRVYDFQRLQELSHSSHNGRVNGLRFLDGGRLLLSSGEDGVLRIWESASGKELWRAAKGDDHVANLAVVTPDEKLAITAGLAADQAEGGKHYVLHVWKLPPLDSLKSTVISLVALRQDLQNLSTCDPDLALLKSQMDSDWQSKVTAGQSARLNLDVKYVEMLRAELPKLPPSERDQFLNEISRVSNNEPTPSSAPNGASPNLQFYFNAYLKHVTEIKNGLANFVKDHESQFTTLSADRKQHGDERGAARAKLVWDEWSQSHRS